MSADAVRPTRVAGLRHIACQPSSDAIILTCVHPSSSQSLPRAIEAAAAAMRHLSSDTCANVENLNSCSDAFVRSLKEAHANLSTEIEQAPDRVPHERTADADAARWRTQLVGLRAAVMSLHLRGMLASMDEPETRKGT
jgi:hypothetical protein